MNEHVHIRGSHKNLGEVVPRHFLTVLGGTAASAQQCGSGRHELAQPHGRPRGQSLVAARAGQPPLAASFRRGHRPFDRRLRRHGSKAQPPRAARLARCQVGRERLVAQGDAPADADIERFRMSSLPEAASEAIDPDQHALAPDERSAAGSRSDQGHACSPSRAGSKG